MTIPIEPSYRQRELSVRHSPLELLDKAANATERGEREELLGAMMIAVGRVGRCCVKGAELDELIALAIPLARGDVDAFDAARNWILSVLVFRG